MVELLSPAGDLERLKFAFMYGADAVYIGGQNYSLRAFATNIEDDNLVSAVRKVHSYNKKAYVTLNVFARNKDFEGLADYLKILVTAKVDAVIVSDLGVFQFVREHEPSLKIHVSTQANTTNLYSANAWVKMGAERIILARELSLSEVTEIAKSLPKGVSVECFVHGAMCISYSGRCLLSNYLAQRDSNHGECVQACRWHYKLIEDSRPDDALTLEEDNSGAYILNSKDLCLIEHLDKLYKAGVDSFKVEGRMKSAYYVATVINAYRRAIDKLYADPDNYKLDEELLNELNKASHRSYTTGFMIKENGVTQNYASSSQEQESVFRGVVLDDCDGTMVKVEQRNKFSVGDELEILSPTESFNKKIKITKIINSKGNETDVAKLVCEKVVLQLDTRVKLLKGDILRSK